MSASEKKLLVPLLFFFLLIATVNAKALSQNEVEKTNYFENLLNSLVNAENIPIVGAALRPYITRIYSLAKEIDKWSDGSLSSLVNSIFPCDLTGPVLTCTGNLDRDSLHKLLMKALSALPIANSMLPLIELASQMVV